MKTLILFFSAVLLIGSGIFKNAQETGKINSEVNIQKPLSQSVVPVSGIKDKQEDRAAANRDMSADKNWSKEVYENIYREEYNISFSKELDAFQSPNRKNNIRFIYHKDGFTAKTRASKIPLFDINDKSVLEKDKKYKSTEEWSATFGLSDANFQSSFPSTFFQSTYKNGNLLDNEFKVVKNKAYIENENIRIEYTNSEEGMRQDFIIKNKSGNEGKFRLNLSVDTKLKMIAGADALMFKDEKGVDRLKYSSLKVYDANGKVLRAYFEKNNKLQTGGDKLQTNDQKLFAIVVNDADAVYPVTIDPLSTTPDWTAESNQADAQFGYSVSTAGDVNGDGYSDAVIGAPYFDNGTTDAGKTFVYYGSITGLSATQSWTAEGNPNVVNLGYSVSTAGDVNGDGYSDLLVGVTNSISNLPWIQKSSGTIDDLQDVYFTSVSNGWASGTNGVIVATTNGGENWTTQTSGTTNALRSIRFTTADSGWTVGVGGTIKFTTDGGANWVTQTSGTTTNLNCVYFRTSTQGWVTGINGLIRTTTNSGVNWTAQSSGVTADLRDIFFASSAEGWVAGVNGRILKTTNGGLNWILQTSGTTQTLRGIYFASSTTGWVFGHAGTILYTTNGGANWSPQTSGTTQDLYGCFFTSSTTGWTTGFGGTVLKTTNGGLNWVSRNGGVGGDMRSIFFSAVDSGIVVGNTGLIYKYNASATGTGGITYVYHGSSSGLSPTTSSILASGTGSNSNGSVVSSAGDINGDGYSDVLVGYPLHTGSGKVFIYHGSASGLQTIPNSTLTGTQTDELFGCSVSTAGDVDGDGYSDIITGSSNYKVGPGTNGKAFVYRGSASGIVTAAYWSQTGGILDPQYGYSVSTAGDVNGDGYSDIIVGAPQDLAAFYGKAYLYFGSASAISATENWSATVSDAGAKFGTCVSTAGDINGDGYADVIIGAPYYDNGQTDEGRAYLFQGSAAGLSLTADWITESDQTSALYGNCVSTAGDVNGDGLSDIIVGSKLFDNGQTDEGRAFVYNGSASGLSSVFNWSSESNQVNSYFGFSVSTAGDVNADGYADVIIGAPYFDNGQTDEGRAFVFHGSSSGLSVSSDWTGESNQANALFGISVSTAGDVNGDGYSDVIIGSNQYSNGQLNEGKVFVYYGSSSGLSLLPGWSAESNIAGANFGNSVSTAGDVNGDGYSDVIIGAYNYGSAGSAFVYNGSAAGLSLTSSWNSNVNQFASEFGYSVSSAGDINGDSYSDVIIGARLYDNGQTNEGRAFVYNGSASGLSSTANWTAESNQANADFGVSVSSAGDVNGDGFSDVIVGADFYTNGESNEGRAFVYHGSASGLSLTANQTEESNQADSRFGCSVSTAGDVNGDGYSDVIVGAFNYDNGETDEGATFEYQGSSSGLSSNSNWTSESNQSGSKFGCSVSTAGDVNGDGYSDVITGAYFYDNGETDEGSAFVYYGSSGASLRANLQQYKPGTGNVVSSGNLTGTNGQVRFNIYGKSPFGRADGKIVYEYKDNGTPFSGSVISRSTSFSGSGTNTDLGTSVAGVQINNDISGLSPVKEYKWRARVQYSLVNNPYQKFSPWKYYNSYIPVPSGNFRASDGLPFKQLNLTMLIEGFYNSSSDLMAADSVTVYLRNGSFPYAVADSAKALLNSSGAGTFLFQNASNGVNYYLKLSHRNSIETWSNSTQTFTSNTMTYNFKTAITQAFGNNMIQIDTSPVYFGIFSGDVNKDGTIDASDVSQTDNDSYNSLSGYVITDVTGDNFVDAADVSIVDNNAYNSVSVVSP
jgi:photosystem II stability/assembly factor-like uncharacterized protein